MEKRCVSKLEVFFKLCASGWRPVDSIPAGAMEYKADSEKLVLVPMLRRSKDYFVALVRSPSLFDRGLLGISHYASANYYKCLLKLKEFTALNALTDAETIADKE